MTDTNARPLPKSTQRLVDALTAANAPADFIEDARRNVYHDFLTRLATPIMDLVARAELEGLRDIANAARRGDFDAGPDDGWRKVSK